MSGNPVMAWRLLEPRPVGKNSAIAVLDVGTTQMCCYIARQRSDGTFDLLATGHQVTDGLKAGQVVDAEAVEASIMAVVHEAEAVFGETLRDIVLGITTGRPCSRRADIDITLGGRPVTDQDVARVLEHARAEMANAEFEVLHSLPVDMRIDDGPRLRDPRGMRGQRLSVTVHVAGVAAQPLNNLIACVERCHLDIADVIAAPYAAAIACLSEDEAREGAVVLDMGGGTTGLAVFDAGRLQHIDIIPIGGDHLTRDLAYGLVTNPAHAERVKNLYGSALWRSCDERRLVEVPRIGEHPESALVDVPRWRLTEIIRPRIGELFQLVRDALDKADGIGGIGLRRLVLTGGASELDGLDEFAAEEFDRPVRIGRPCNVRGRRGLADRPGYSAAAGLLSLATRDDGGLSYRAAGRPPLLAGGLTRFGQWIRENF